MESSIQESTVVLERLVIQTPAKVDSRQKFINLIDSILRRTGFDQLGTCIGRDNDPDLFITINELNELKLLSGELKLCNTMHKVNEIQLKHLLIVLERSIRLGCGNTEFSSCPESMSPEEKLFDYVTHELSMQAITAVSTVLNIITCDNMSRNIYTEDLLNSVLQFLSYQLQNVIFPAFDPFYRIEQKSYERSYSKKNRNKLKILYRNLLAVIEVFSKFIELNPLPERTLSLIVTLAGSILIVDNVEELYCCAIKIIAKTFQKHEKSKSLVSRVLSFVATVCDSKLGNRSYKINPTCKITNVTALILELVQCYVDQPTDLENRVKIKEIVQGKYNVAVRVAGGFISQFFNTCIGKKGEPKKKFKAFVEDLLVLVDRPEWPASEMLLYLLCNLFVNVLKSKQANVQTRTMCLEYLGLIISSMQKYKIEAQNKLSKMSELIKIYKEREIFGNINKKISTLPIEVQRRLFLQHILIHYLKYGRHMDFCISDPIHYNVVSWYNDTEKQEKSKGLSEPSKKKQKISDDPEENKNAPKSFHSFKIEKMILKTNLFSVGKIVCPITKQPLVEYNDTKIICKYLNSKRYFSESYQIYLKHIFCALSDSSIQVQSTAMKSITMVIDTEPELLNDTALEKFVSHSLSHTSISVREAALNLIGKYVLRQPGIINKYDYVLIGNVLDSGISVRKRAIKILKEICFSNTNFSKLSDVCKVMVGCVNDEGIKKMVLQFFHELWFSKVEDELLMDKVANILNVVTTFESSHFNDFQVLLQKLLNSKEGIDSKEASLSCQRISNSLIHIIISDQKLRETLTDVTDNNMKKKLSENVVSCFAILAVISKTDPQLLVSHAISLKPFLYFDVKKGIKEIYDIISSVLQIMEAIVPVIEHPSALLLTEIEEACINIILLQNGSLMKPAFSCLSAITNKVTHNYKLIKDFLIKFLRHTVYLKDCHLKSSKDGLYHDYLKRCLLILGYCFQFFDLRDKMETTSQYDLVKKCTFEVLIYFSNQTEVEIQRMALQSLGSFCIRYSTCMLLPEIKELYQNILSSQVVHVHLLLQVLCTFQDYLKDVEDQLVFNEKKSKQKTETSLKQLGEDWSENTAKIFQLHIVNILAAYKHSHCPIRYGVFKIIVMLISQGILNPVTFVSQLICAATEDVYVFKQSAVTELRKITLKYPCAMKTMAVKGILLTQEVHCLLENKKVPRGVNQNNIAVNNVVYDIIQTSRNSRQNFIKSVMQLFNKQDIGIEKLIFICDNLASFTYQILDEVLFLIYQIDITINVNGRNCLLHFEEALTPAGKKTTENPEMLVRRMPESFRTLQNCIQATEKYELLLMLRKYVKKAFNIDDKKLVTYKPSAPLNLYDKPIRRNMSYKFNPETVLWRLSVNENNSESNEKKYLAVRYLEFKKLLEAELQDSDASLSDEEANSSTHALTVEGNQQKIKTVDSALRKRQSTIVGSQNKKKRTQ